MHRHGSYDRYKSPSGTEREDVQRFLCVPCGKTVSVLNDNRLPYRSIHVDQLETWMDWLFCGGPEPPVKEIERDCLKRATRCFVRNSPSLREALGQMVKDIGAEAKSLWRNLHRLGDLREILRILQEKIKFSKNGRGLSLLGSYVCLAAWSG